MILNSCDGLKEEDIRKLSHEELIQAVLRTFSCRTINCQDWFGTAYGLDDIADAFRGR